MSGYSLFDIDKPDFVLPTGPQHENLALIAIWEQKTCKTCNTVFSFFASMGIRKSYELRGHIDEWITGFVTVGHDISQEEFDRLPREVKVVVTTTPCCPQCTRTPEPSFP